MTQTRWRISAALLLSTLLVGASRGEEPAPEKAPKKDCPVLSKILFINQLFKNVSAPPRPPAAACPCQPGKPSEGCCCSDHAAGVPAPAGRAAPRCCPATGVCCPGAPTPACVPPPPAPMAPPYFAPPPPMAMPPVGIYPAVPPPAPMMSPDWRTYVVDLKVMESRPGEEEKLVAQPQLMVTAGQPASLCCPVAGQESSPISSAGVQDIIGEQGLDVRVIPAGNHGRVLLDVTVHKVEQDRKAGSCYVEQISAVRMCKQVKLGKTIKLPCEVPTTGEKVHCRIEATVKESPDGDVSVCAPPAMMPPCAEPCPCPTPIAAPPTCSPIAPVGCCEIPVMPTPCGTAPAKKHFSKMTLRVVKENGKSRLEMENGNTRVLCEKTVLQLHECRPLEVSVMGKQVSLSCECWGPAHRPALKVKADRVSTAPHGCLLLEGHVHVEGTGDHEVIDIQGGKVRLKLPDEIIQTGVISSPTLIQ